MYPQGWSEIQRLGHFYACFPQGGELNHLAPLPFVNFITVNQILESLHWNHAVNNLFFPEGRISSEEVLTLKLRVIYQTLLYVSTAQKETRKTRVQSDDVSHASYNVNTTCVSSSLSFHQKIGIFFLPMEKKWAVCGCELNGFHFLPVVPSCCCVILISNISNIRWANILYCREGKLIASETISGNYSGIQVCRV